MSDNTNEAENLWKIVRGFYEAISSKRDCIKTSGFYDDILQVVNNSKESSDYKKQFNDEVAVLKRMYLNETPDNAYVTKQRYGM